MKIALPKINWLAISELKKKFNKMIETERLFLKPLTYEQLVKYTKCDNSLEEELNLNETSRTISPELKAVSYTHLRAHGDRTRSRMPSSA